MLPSAAASGHHPETYSTVETILHNTVVLTMAIRKGDASVLRDNKEDKFLQLTPAAGIQTDANRCCCLNDPSRLVGAIQTAA